MINFESMFGTFETTIKNMQKKVEGNFPLKVYYGINAEGMYRLAFLSSISSIKIESTRLIKIVQGEESKGVNWTCFDLLSSASSKVFYALCGDLVGCIEECIDEKSALLAIRNRFTTWRNVFRKSSTRLTDEKVKGLFGELYFLKSFMIKEYGINDAVSSWSGAELTSKDFSIADTWYEVKTMASTSYSVKISSLSQLSSNKIGHLIVIKLERMAETFSTIDSSIEQLVQYMLSNISELSIREKFINKLSNYGYGVDDEANLIRFDVKDFLNYKVDGSFPRITEKDINFQEIMKVTYELVINTLEKHKGRLF